LLELEVPWHESLYTIASKILHSLTSRYSRHATLAHACPALRSRLVWSTLRAMEVIDQEALPLLPAAV
jgi:hypothetical protein